MRSSTSPGSAAINASCKRGRANAQVGPYALDKRCVSTRFNKLFFQGNAEPRERTRRVRREHDACAKRRKARIALDQGHFLTRFTERDRRR
jgi:hypothetical protein